MLGYFSFVGFLVVGGMAVRSGETAFRLLGVCFHFVIPEIMVAVVKMTSMTMSSNGALMIAFAPPSPDV